MTLIRKASELEIQGKIKALIYGQPGMGKSTLAVSTPKPLLFDFDGGVHRINYHHLENVDTVQIKNYQNFLDVLQNENLGAYETLVIDTGGKMLDHMSEYIIKNDPKKGRSNGMLTLQGYGERKGLFTSLVKKISVMGKHIVFVAHRDTKTEGEDTRYVPQFGGSNYDALVTELDLVGYMEANGRQRTITFDPTDRNDGKNTCNLPAVMQVPAIVDENGSPTSKNDFMSEKVIKPYYARLEQRKQAGKDYQKIIEDVKENLLLATDAATLNDCVERIVEWDHIGNSKTASGKLIKEKANELNLKLNKDKVYEPEAATV